MDDKYLEAAKAIARSSRKNLPLVLESLRESGIDVDGIMKRSEEYELKKKEQKVWVRPSRSGLAEKEWKESHDELTLYLRKAFDDGISFKRVRELSGVHKTTVYRILWGESHGAPKSRNSIRNALDILYAEKDGSADLDQ